MRTKATEQATARVDTRMQIIEAARGLSTDKLQLILAYALQLLVDTGRATDEDKTILAALKAHARKQAA